MSIRGKENMEIRVYETIDNGRPVQKIGMKHAEILSGSFRDFIGTPNGKGTLIRKMTIAVPLHLVDFLKENGIPVGRWIPEDVSDDEINDFDALLTVKINYDFYKQPVIVAKVGEDGKYLEISENQLHSYQNSVFDDANISGRVSRGTYMGKPYTTIYLDQAKLTVHKNEIPPMEQEMFGDMYDEEDIPFA